MDSSGKQHRSFRALRGILPLLVLFSLACNSPAEELPSGDKCATNWFGVSFSVPICSGYLFVAGRYLDAPYVVEQRGYSIFINGVFVEDSVDPRLVFPEPPEPPVTVDPGFPVDLTYSNTVSEAMMHPVTSAKGVYFKWLGLGPDERAKKYVEYFESLPCIAKAEEIDDGPVILLELYDNQGGHARMGIEREAIPPRREYSRQELKERFIIPKREMIENMLRSDRHIMASGKSIQEDGPPIAPNLYWQSVFSILESDSPLEAKVVRLQGIGFINQNVTIESVPGLYGRLITNFKGSEQLTRRLHGDESWKTSCVQKSAESAAVPKSAQSADSPMEGRHLVASKPDSTAP